MSGGATDVSKSTVLVTGGTGYLGTELIRQLRDHAHPRRIVSLALAPPRHPLAGVDYLTCDLSDEAGVRRAVEGLGVDTVFNLAGLLTKTQKAAEERGVVDQHFHALNGLLAALDGGALRALVHVGSAEEYGAAASPQHEALPCQPVSIYGYAKFVATEYLLMKQRRLGLPALVVRPFNIYGGGATAGIIPYVLQRALRDEPFDISPAEQTRDFIYIDDVIEALLTLGQSLVREPARFAGQVFNVSSSKGVRLKEVVSLVCRECHYHRDIAWGSIPYREGEAMEAFGSGDKLMRYTAFAPRVGLHEGIARTIEHARSTHS